MIQVREPVTFSTPAAQAAAIDWLSVSGEEMVVVCSGQPSCDLASAKSGLSGAHGVRQGTTFARREQSSPIVVSAEASNAGDAWPLTPPRKMVAGAPFKGITKSRPCRIDAALHAGHTARRFRYDSLERSRLLDSGEADFVDVKK